MTMFRSSGLQKRTTIALLWASGLALVFISACLFFYQTGSLKARVQQTLAPYADMVTVTAEVAVDFEDASRALQILETLRKDPQILRADLVLPSGTVLATYPANSPPLEAGLIARNDGVYLEGKTAVLIRSLAADTASPSHFIIQLDLARIRQQDRQTLVLGGLAALVMLLVITVTQLLLLQRTVLSPVAQLAATVAQARENADYRQRVPVSGRDELATLGDSFNALLETVEQREAALQRLTNYQRAILDNAAYAIISVDAKGVITSFNPAAERMLGYSAAELVGGQTPAIFHVSAEVAARAAVVSARLGEPVAAGFETFVAEARRNMPSEAEWTYVRKDGGRVLVQLSITALRDSRGGIFGFLGLASDITERKQTLEALAHSERRLQQAFTATSDAIWEWNLTTNETYYSSRWYEILGYADQAFAMNFETFRSLCHPDDLPVVLAQVQTVLQRQAPAYEAEFRMRTKAGDWRWILGRGTIAQKNAADQVVGLSGTNSDITEAKLAKVKLEASEARYRQLFENMITGFALHEIICDAQGQPVDYRFLEVNPAFERLTGLVAASLLGRTVLEVMPNTEKHWIDTFGRVAQTGEPLAYENYAVALGKYYDTWVFSPQRGQFAVVFSDITPRKQFEVELRQKNSLLEATLQATADGILVVAADGGITGYNQQLVRLWQMPGELLETKDSTRLFAHLQAQLRQPDVGTDRNQNFNQLTEGETFDVLNFADGRVFESYSRPQLVDGLVVGRVWSFRDVSVARQTEAALRDSEYKFKTLYETANDAIFLMNGPVCLDCNHRAAEMFGCPQASLIGTVHTHFSPERQADGATSLERGTEKIAATLAGQPQSFEWIHCRADGTPFNTEVSLNRIELHGEFLLQAIVRDITQRKLAEAARHAAEELYRTLVNASPDGITVLDLAGHITYSSPRALALYRLPDAAAAQGVSALQYVAPGDLPRAQKLLQAAANGQFAAAERFVLTRGDGTQFVAELSGALLRDRQGVPSAVMVLTHDVTDRQQQDDELKSKNAELERFTYTVSHDLKSPLITIKGFAGALLADLAAGRSDRLTGDLKRIILAADKMTELLNGLLELSRIGRMVNLPQSVAMTALVQSVLELLSGSIAQRQARITVQPDLPIVQGDPHRLQEVLQNLVENALKFPLADRPPEIEIGTEPLGGQRAFFVRDHGRGIEPCYQETIFGLFNKLDARSEGSGIGLALVRRIVEYHGGRIWVVSKGLGHGTTFYFTLPPGRAISPAIQPTPQTKL